MKTIVITGPSGSGKSFLANKLSEIFYNSIILRTDSYYRDNLLIKFLSLFIYYIYDLPISIKKSKIIKTHRFIHNKERLISFDRYDFKKKKSYKSKKFIKYEGDYQFIILEGIFSHRLNLNYEETINIVCEEEKEICFKRRLIRDQLERNRCKNEVYNKFNKSWDLFHDNAKEFVKNNKVIPLILNDEISYKQLIFTLKNLKK